ncbi:MAG TPA: VIT1/CCC1 transporter family protein, partial [Candidatus Cybelea sp.]|nr:VIT1/CCC1 transporter family protein [Candidatus Cybelea sp.]
NATSADSKMDPRDRRRILKILESNWQAEMRGYHTYEILAERESDPARRAAFHTLSHAEQHHAQLWAERIRALGGSDPVYRGPKAGEADTLANRAGGVRLALRRLELDESRDIAKYAKQIKELGDEPSVRILEQALKDEREHYQTLSGLIRNRRPIAPSSPEQAKLALDELLAARQEDHPRAAGWIGDAIYGINDGLGAIFGIVSGVSGATLGNSKFVIIAGMVGMIASALSMGSGAFLAAKSEREIYEAEFSREREAVENNEAEAREVLSLSYQIRGLPPEEADRFVEHLAKDKSQFVRTLAQERLNTTEDGLRKPLTSAISGALSTALGATIPVIPFFFLSGYPAVIVAAIVSLLAHFAVGAAKSLITIRSWWASGLEMTFVGAVEGVVTYFIGIAIGRISGAGI